MGNESYEVAALPPGNYRGYTVVLDQRYRKPHVDHNDRIIFYPPYALSEENWQKWWKAYIRQQRAIAHRALAISVYNANMELGLNPWDHPTPSIVNVMDIPQTTTPEVIPVVG